MSSGVMMCGYMGDIYLDIPYDKDLPLHQELEAYLQYSDDRMRFDNVMFLYMPLVWCLKSKHQIMVLAARATDAKMVSALLCHTNGLGSSL